MMMFIGYLVTLVLSVFGVITIVVLGIAGLEYIIDTMADNKRRNDENKARNEKHEYIILKKGGGSQIHWLTYSEAEIFLFELRQAEADRVARENAQQINVQSPRQNSCRSDVIDVEFREVPNYKRFP